jgi:alcohol dehydrogenase class IV
MDSTKLIACGLTQREGIRGIFQNGVIEKPGIDTLMIPTTAGTGAEVTPNAIYVDDIRAIYQQVV